MMDHMRSVKGPGISEHVRSVVLRDLVALRGDIGAAGDELDRLNMWNDGDLVRVQKLKRDSRGRKFLSPYFSLFLRPRMGDDASDNEHARMEKERPLFYDSVDLWFDRLLGPMNSEQSEEISEEDLELYDRECKAAEEARCKRKENRDKMLAAL